MEKRFQINRLRTESHDGVPPEGLQKMLAGIAGQDVQISRPGSEPDEPETLETDLSFSVNHKVRELFQKIGA